MADRRETTFPLRGLELATPGHQLEPGTCRVMENLVPAGRGDQPVWEVPKSPEPLPPSGLLTMGRHDEGTVLALRADALVVIDRDDWSQTVVWTFAEPDPTRRATFTRLRGVTFAAVTSGSGIGSPEVLLEVRGTGATRMEWPDLPRLEAKIVPRTPSGFDGFENPDTVFPPVPRKSVLFRFAWELEDGTISPTSTPYFVGTPSSAWEAQFEVVGSPRSLPAAWRDRIQRLVTICHVPVLAPVNEGSYDEELQAPAREQPGFIVHRSEAYDVGDVFTVGRSLEGVLSEEPYDGIGLRAHETQAGALYAYNRRLILGDAAYDLTRPDLERLVEWEGGTSNAGGDDYHLLLRVVVRTSEGELTRLSRPLPYDASSIQDVTLRERLVSYPDARAKRYTFFVSKDYQGSIAGATWRRPSQMGMSGRFDGLAGSEFVADPVVRNPWDFALGDEVIDLNTSDDEVIVEGDQTASYKQGDTIRWDGHPEHDGQHTISGSPSTRTNNDTVLPLSTDLTVGTVEGTIVNTIHRDVLDLFSHPHFLGSTADRPELDGALDDVRVWDNVFEADGNRETSDASQTTSFRFGRLFPKGDGEVEALEFEVYLEVEVGTISTSYSEGTATANVKVLDKSGTTLASKNESVTQSGQGTSTVDKSDLTLPRSGNWNPGEAHRVEVDVSADVRAQCSDGQDDSATSTEAGARVSGSLLTVTRPTGESTTALERSTEVDGDGNRIVWSAPNKPWALPAENLTYAGEDDRVLAMQATGQEVSAAQFGDYPIVVFNEQSVRIMQVGEQPFIQGVSLLTNDEGVVGRRATTPVDGQVAAALDGGVYAFAPQLDLPALSAPIHDTRDRVLNDLGPDTALGHYTDADRGRNCLWVGAKSKTLRYDLRWGAWSSLLQKRRDYALRPTDPLALSSGGTLVLENQTEATRSVRAQTAILPAGPVGLLKRAYEAQVRQPVPLESLTLTLVATDPDADNPYVQLGSAAVGSGADADGLQLGAGLGPGYVLDLKGDGTPGQFIEALYLRWEVRDRQLRDHRGHGTPDYGNSAGTLILTNIESDG
jgi:hypothetical protein